jgi:hypothetical protein
LLGLEADNKPRATPDLNGMTVHKPLGLDDGLAIVATDQRLVSDEMPICTHRVKPVLCHWLTNGFSSPVKSLATSGDRIGSGTSQLMQRNLRPPVFTSTNFIGFLHFVQLGGGAFLGMGCSRNGKNFTDTNTKRT